MPEWKQHFAAAHLCEQDAYNDAMQDLTNRVALVTGRQPGNRSRRRYRIGWCGCRCRRELPRTCRRSECGLRRNQSDREENNCGSGRCLSRRRREAHGRRGRAKPGAVDILVNNAAIAHPRKAIRSWRT